MLNEDDLGDAAAKLAFKFMSPNLRQILEIEAKNQGCGDPLLLEKVTPGADQAFTLFRSIQSRILAGGDGSKLTLVNVNGLFGIE